MTNRELLELAAKAAGIEGWWSGDDFCYGYNGNQNIPVPWRPLTDDGDALRLAVDMEFHIRSLSNGESLLARVIVDCAPTHAGHGNDRCAPMRRAIVRAAAEIGKAMP